MVKTVLLLLVLGLAADAGATDKPNATLDRKVFATQHAEILQKLDDGKSYSEISEADQRTVRSALERIDRSLDEAGGSENLSVTAKVRIFNDQEQVNTILTQAAGDSRLVCRREQNTGSHRTTSQCMTVAERNRAREHAANELRRRPTPVSAGN